MLLLFFLFSLVPNVFAAGGGLLAGVSKVDATLPVGVPLAGYNYPPRRGPHWPIPDPGRYTTFMTPSVGVRDRTWAKALILKPTAEGSKTMCMLTLDVIGSDASLLRRAVSIARARGFTACPDDDDITMSAAHTHSGPGAIVSEFLWSMAPATDLAVPELQEKIAGSLAQALIEAEADLSPAVLGLGGGDIIGFTHNRRHKYPGEWSGKVNPRANIMRVDSPTGEPRALLWNFPIHGICFDAPNLSASSDIMGAVSQAWEDAHKGAVALFANGAEGDVNPVFSKCCTSANGTVDLHGGPVIAGILSGFREATPTTDQVSIDTAAQQVVFNGGMTAINLTLARVANCTRGGPLDICSICRVIDCEVIARLGPSWTETSARFNAAVLTVGGRRVPLVTVPGEALTAVGWAIRNDTESLGFNGTEAFLFGLTNSHLGYFAGGEGFDNQYAAGGYEALLTFFGPGTAQVVREGAIGALKAAMASVTGGW